MTTNQLTAELMKNPEFMEMFQRALGEGKIPDEKDPNREKWLKEIQSKMAEESKKEIKRKLETPVTDDEGTWMWIVPESGFCIKCTTTNGGKVFINICQHERIAEPIPLLEEEQDDNTAIKFKIPLSCGQARSEVDKSGKPCKAYDVIVNLNTIKRCGDDNEFRRFVAALCMTWIKQKSEQHLNADEFKNVNFKCKGTPEPQRIRLAEASKPDNALNGEINLPKKKGGATEPTVKGGSDSKKKMVQIIEPSANGKDASAKDDGDQSRPQPQCQVEPSGTYCWSQHKKATKSPYFRESVPERYIITVTLPCVQTIKEIDVQVKNKRVDFIYVDKDDEKPFFIVPLAFPVADDPLHAKFTRATKTLVLHLAVSLPKDDEVSTGVSRDAEEEEEEMLKKEQEASEKRIAEHRAKMERLQKEEEEVMRQRKEWVSNISSVAKGDLPPLLKEDINKMDKEQQHAMLMRLENKIMKEDSIDVLLQKMSEDALYSLTVYLRDKLGLAYLSPKKTPEKKVNAVLNNETTSTWEKQLEDDKKNDTVEYNFAKKSAHLFGVEMSNRYLFALDH